MSLEIPLMKIKVKNMSDIILRLNKLTSFSVCISLNTTSDEIYTHLNQTVKQIGIKDKVYFINCKDITKTKSLQCELPC